MAKTKQNKLEQFSAKSIMDFGKAMFPFALSYVALKVIERSKSDNPEEHEAAREKLFQIVTKSCNSFGVNKMGIVNQAAYILQDERIARIKAEKRIEELEAEVKKLKSKK